VNYLNDEELLLDVLQLAFYYPDDFEFLKYIDEKFEAVQLAAVEQFGSVIKYLKNPSEVVQLAALRIRPTVIGFIDEPTDAALKAADRSPLEDMFKGGAQTHHSRITPRKKRVRQNTQKRRSSRRCHKRKRR